MNQQQTLEEKMREDRDSLVERLHRQTAEYSAFKLENERLKVCERAGLIGNGKGLMAVRAWLASGEDHGGLTGPGGAEG